MKIVTEETKKSIRDWYEDFKLEVKIRAQLAWDWCRNNKEILKIIGPAVISGIFGLTKAAINAKSKREAREMEEMKDYRPYDPVIGMRVEVVRPLTTEEKYYLAKKREETRKTTTQILKEMGLLDI